MSFIKKIAKIEVQQKDQVLFFAAEIEKSASANKSLTKIIKVLWEKVRILETKIHDVNDVEEEPISREVSKNSPVILPQIEEPQELKDDIEMKTYEVPRMMTAPTSNKNDQSSVNQKDDIWIKIKAFENDFKLPFNGAKVFISSLNGGIDVANGYEKVVADGESLWLELAEHQIFKNNFQVRQRTKTRQYYIMNGVTLHRQLARENHPFPRRQKLAVKIKRSEPCSRLKQGKYYIHVHQIKICNPKIGTRWLGTRRLIQKLVEAFGSRYHPKQKNHSHEIPIVEKNNVRVNHPHPQYMSTQQPLIPNQQSQNIYTRWTPGPIYHANQPHYAFQYNQPSRVVEQNRVFFQRQVQQGVG